MPVVSIDLAYRDYRDLGVAVLDLGPSGAVYKIFDFSRGGRQSPEPGKVADLVLEICEGVGASLLLLDGPQG